MLAPGTSICCGSSCTLGWRPIRTFFQAEDRGLSRCPSSTWTTSAMSSLQSQRRRRTRRRLVQVLALAACLALTGSGRLELMVKAACDQERSHQHRRGHADPRGGRSLGRKVPHAPRVGSALEPGWLRLESGLAQVVFYSGARVVIEGPAELQLVSPNEAVCPTGRLLAEVPRASARLPPENRSAQRGGSRDRVRDRRHPRPN